MKRVALLGGSFDPIHEGHLEMARQARRQLQVDEVWFVVSRDTPLKDRTLTTYENRLHMVKLALTPYRRFKTCTIEREVEGKNYTIDTVHLLKKRYPKHMFYFLIGGDQVKQLDQWKDIDALLAEVKFCCFKRDEEVMQTKYDMRMLSMKPYPISSSEIREGKLQYVHPKVKQYIINQVLYEDILLHHMSHYRYEHSVRVATLAKEIARVHHYDEQVAYRMGMYHDINKEFMYVSKEASQMILEQLHPEVLKQAPGIWHGYMGRYVCDHMLGIQDQRVLNAIEHHVLGDSKSVYAMILYIADKLDPAREYDMRALKKAVLDNLYKGFNMVKEAQKQYYSEECKRGE